MCRQQARTLRLIELLLDLQSCVMMVMVRLAIKQLVSVLFAWHVAA